MGGIKKEKRTMGNKVISCFLIERRSCRSTHVKQRADKRMSEKDAQNSRVVFSILFVLGNACNAYYLLLPLGDAKVQSYTAEL